MKGSLKLGWYCGSFALLLSAAAMIYAQPPPVDSASSPIQSASTGEGLQEVIVTAQRRSESLQKTPLTIEVLRADSLSDAGVTAPAQLTSALPTVQVATAGPATAVYVRGVGGYAANSLTSPAVPYYLDGVYVGRTQSVVSELYDVDRLELVKGPQGTLYGRNASGGAINILTRQPDLTSFSSRGEIEVGDYGNRSVEAAVNFPLNPTLALRVSGTVVDKDGYSSVGLGDDVHQAGRLKLLWAPDAQLSASLNASYGHIGGRGSANVTLNREISGWYPWLDDSDPRARAYVESTAAVPVPGFVRAALPSEARQDLDFYNVSVPIEWRFGSSTLTILPAYRYARMQYAFLLGFLYSNGYGLGALPGKPETSRAASLEMRWSGGTDSLNWVTGAYFYDERQAQQLTIDNGYLSSNGWNLYPLTRSYAGFGQGTFSIASHFRLTGGLRYTSDRRGLGGQFYLVSPNVFQGVPPASGGPCAFPLASQAQCLIDTFRGRKTYDNVSWKGGFEADVLEDSLLYATASRGFKAGGFSQQSLPGNPGSAEPFKPEILTAFDAGLKSRFLGSRLQLNVSAFYWDYKDHQEPVITYSNVPGIVNQIYLNTGTSKMFGGNLDVLARVWSGGTLSAAVEYDHSRYHGFVFATPTFAYDPRRTGCRVAAQDPGTTTLDCSGFGVSRTPEWSGAVGFDQEFQFPRGTLAVNGRLTFASAMWLGTNFVAPERAGAYGKLDLSLSYRAPANRWFITGFVRNVTDTTIYTDGAEAPFSALITANIQPPRTYGARLGFNF